MEDTQHLNHINKRVNELEMRYTRSPRVKIAAALALRCWLAYRASDVPEPRQFLYKANHAIQASLKKNPSSPDLYWLAVFIAIEMDHFDNANEMLDAAMTYKQFFKTNEPTQYALLYGLSAYLETKQNRARSAKKHLRTLEDFFKSQAKPDAALLTVMGMVYLAFDAYDDAYSLLSEAFKKGGRSVFLHFGLFHYYRTVQKSQNTEWLLPVVRWAAVRFCALDELIARYPEELHQAIAGQVSLVQRIYEQYPDPWVLKEICVGYMLAGDFSPTAFAYYRDAERKQIHLPGLYRFLIKAAYENRVEKMQHYSMSEYLRDPDTDVQLRLFVYHLLLTDPALADLIPERKNEILQFSTYCLEQDITGRMANSLYYYFWVQCNEMGITGKNVEKAESLLLCDLAHFEVSGSDGVQFIYVTEREKKGMSVYALVENAVILTAVNENFRYTCLGEGRRNILDESLKIRRMVPRATPALYRYFFKRGERGFAVLAYLTNAYLVRMDDSFDPEEAIPVFEALLEEKEITKPYKMQVSAALGRLYYRTGRFDRALACYGEVDENHLDDAYAEQILNVFIQTHEWARAAGLILRKAHCVPDKSLFAALIILSDKTHAAQHPNLADAAYGLLLRSWYDKRLLSIVLAHYTGNQAEWQALNRALAALSINEPRLDEIILKNSIWMHQFDEDAQKTFVRMVNGTAFNHPVVKQFIYYAVYEMIINDVRPNYEALTVLERAWLESFEKKPEEHLGDGLLAYGLCHVYLRYGLTTFNSEKIVAHAIENQESDGLLYPVFRENRDKCPSTPYIEKNQPFIYRSLPDKNVWLYYRIGDDTVYHAQRMRYVRFGLYMTTLPQFYNEKFSYYFSEEMPTGSITTREKEIRNEVVYLNDAQTDLFFVINNAIIYEQMFKYEQVEKIITGMVRDVRPVRSELL